MLVVMLNPEVVLAVVAADRSLEIKLSGLINTLGAVPNDELNVISHMAPEVDPVPVVIVIVPAVSLPAMLQVAPDPAPAPGLPDGALPEVIK